MSKQDQIQQEIVKKSINFFQKERFGYIDGAMRLGKIKITLDLLTNFIKNEFNILICYPDNQIKNSWENDMLTWQFKHTKNIQFTNYRSLHKYKDNKFDFIVLDEFHEISDLQRQLCHEIMTNSPDTKVLGLSGTVSRETQGLWGLKLIAKYTTLDGIRDKILSDYIITVHRTDLDKVVKTPNSKGKLLTEKQRYDNYSFVIDKMVKGGKNYMHLALTRNRLSTSSIGKINAVKELLDELKDKRTIVFCGITETADSLGIPSYHSKSKDDSNFQAFQKKEINHLALAEMGKTGVSYTNLDSVILMNATSNKESTAQLLNRAIKLDYAGKVADLHVIVLNEKPELKKIKESLSMLDSTKIRYV